MNSCILLALLVPQNDKAQANAYDDAWESAWVGRARTVYAAGTGKTNGKVIHVGDSITHANPYGRWPRSTTTNKSAEDTAVSTWCMAGQAFPGAVDPANANGFYLCAGDVASRSMTASGGITTAEYLSGNNNGGTAMPSTTDTATARSYVSSTTYTNNLHITTVAAAFADSRFAVVMLGTNDSGANRAAGDVATDLTAIVDALESRNIVPILSTIPPRADRDVTAINAAIRSLAQSRSLALIDYYAEILARRPGTTWQGTLISSDGIHPSSVTPEGDVYQGGDITAHRTGTLATNDGYVLRGWLTMQKLKEVKSYVVDGVNPPTPVAGTSSDDDDDDDNACACGTIRPGFPWPLGLLGLLLGALRRRVERV